MKSSIAGVVLGMTLTLSPAYGFDPAPQATHFDSTVATFDTTVFIDVLLKGALFADTATLLQQALENGEVPPPGFMVPEGF